MGLSLIDEFLRTVCQFNGFDEVAVITNQKSICGILRTHNISTYYSVTSDNETLQLESVFDCLLFIEKYLKSISIYNEDVIMINFRNPLIDRQAVNEAIKLYREVGSGILMSVVLSSDHPCQLFHLDEAIESTHIKDKIYISNTDQGCFQSRPFPPAAELWVVEENGVLINTIDNIEISGRQDFPEVYHPDNSLFIINVAAVKAMKSSSSNSIKIYGYPINKNKSLLIYDKIDFLKLKAMKKSLRLGHTSR